LGSFDCRRSFSHVGCDGLGGWTDERFCHDSPIGTAFVFGQHKDGETN
jgi:hypothetical protein